MKKYMVSSFAIMVLLALHFTVSAQPAGNTGAQVTDPNQDTGFSWIREQGKGRIFYTVLGHGGGRKCLEFENAANIEHLLLGIQWALGDIDGVDAIPKGIK